MARDEVRAAYLHPRDFRRRLKDRPVAWLPVGTLEWHGFHLPIGFDGVKAELLSVKAAEHVGGVVFPALYYGDHRGILQEAMFLPGIFPGLTYDHRAELARELGGDAFLHAANADREQAAGALDRHVELLLRVFWGIRAYGFTRIVAIAGHYPNVVPLRAAAARFHGLQGACRVIVGTEEELSEISGGDHAARYETSQMMVLAPELVRLDELEAERAAEPLGVFGLDPTSAGAALGTQIVEGFIRSVQAKLGEVPPMPRFSGRDEDGLEGIWPANLSDPDAIEELFTDPANRIVE
jgi:creatinine amidohydrolase